MSHNNILMKCNSKIVLVKPYTDASSAFEGEVFNKYRGEVINIADDVSFCKVGDDIIFFTITPFIEEEKFYAIQEGEILINMTEVSNG